MKTLTLSLLLTGLFAACSDEHSLGEGARNAPLDGGPGGSSSGASGTSGSAGSGGEDAAGGTGGSGGSVAGSSGDGGTGGDTDAGRCCPPDPTPNCCMQYGGVRRGGSCGAVCDGMPWPSPLWRLENDEYGCPVWVEPPRIPGNCCGCLPIDSGPLDSGRDSAPIDAGTD